MKKKINVTIHNHGSENEIILKCIGNMNSGECSFSPRDLEGYYTIQTAKYPKLPVTITKLDESGDIYQVSENEGKSFTLTLEWIEVYELQPMD